MLNYNKFKAYMSVDLATLINTLNNKVDDARKSIGHMLWTLMVYQQPEIERKIIEGDRGEPIK